MIFFNQLAAAVLLLSLTLCLQCAGVTTRNEWLKRLLSRDIHKRGPIYSATLVVKSTVAIVILHGLVILLRASFYRTRCFPSMCGISVSVVFALVTRLLDRDTPSLRTNSTEQSHA